MSESVKNLVIASGLALFTTLFWESLIYWLGLSKEPGFSWVIYGLALFAFLVFQGKEADHE